MCVVRRRSNHPGDLRAGDERRLRLVLVEAAGQQCVWERRPGGVHLDDHAIARGFVDVAHLDRVRAIESSQHCCTMPKEPTGQDGLRRGEQPELPCAAAGDVDGCIGSAIRCSFEVFLGGSIR